MKDLSKTFLHVHSAPYSLPSAHPHNYGQIYQYGLQMQEQTPLALQLSQHQLPQHQMQQHQLPQLQLPPATGQDYCQQQNIPSGVSWMYSPQHGYVPVLTGYNEHSTNNISLEAQNSLDMTQQSVGPYSQFHQNQMQVQDKSSSLFSSQALSSLYSSLMPISSPLSSSNTSSPISLISNSPPLESLPYNLPVQHIPNQILQIAPAINNQMSLLAKIGLTQNNKKIYKSFSEKKRSRLLEDFRNNLLAGLSLSDLTGHVIEFAEDQHGSRFIQQKLETAGKREKEDIFQELYPTSFSLMTDVFGNYVIQKMLEHGSDEQRIQLMMKVLPHVESLAVQMYGCRVIQKMIETVEKEQLKLIIKKLDTKVEELVKDQNGNHVIQKCIEVVDPNDLQFILDTFKNQVFKLSCHPYGCRVVQRLLEHCLESQTHSLLEELLVHAEQLIQDQYGNYVVQHVLDHGEIVHKSRIAVAVSGRVALLSQHKFASNVVEKCVSNVTNAERSSLIKEICQDDSDSASSSLAVMIKDQYANYVVQRMIDTADDEDLSVLMRKIRSHISTLHKFAYGKHILTKLESYYAKQKVM